MLDLDIKSEFWRLREGRARESDNQRVFTLVRLKTIENCTTGSKPVPRALRGLDRNDLRELIRIAKAALMLMRDE